MKVKKHQPYGPAYWNGLYPTEEEKRWDHIQHKRYLRETHTLRERIGFWFGFGMVRTPTPWNPWIPRESEAAEYKKFALGLGFTLTPEQARLFHENKFHSHKGVDDLHILFSVLDEEQRLQFRKRYQ